MNINLEILGARTTIQIPENADFSWLINEVELLTAGSGMVIPRDQQFISIMVSISILRGLWM